MEYLNSSLQQLQFFRAVAHSLSFTHAAEQLYTSQPRVSVQIKKLESQLGVELFVRTSSKVTLTEAGRDLLGLVERILDGVSELEQRAKEYKGLDQGSVRVGASQNAGSFLLPELIASFRLRYPGIVVSLLVGNTDTVVEWLDQGEVEIGVSPREKTTPAVSSELFHTEPLIVIYPPDLDLPDPLPPEDFSRLPLVARETGSLTGRKLAESIRAYSRDLDMSVVQLDGTTAVIEGVAAGLGASLVPERSAKAWIEAEMVKGTRLLGQNPCHHYFIHTRTKFVPPATRAFVAHLRQHQFSK